MNSIDTGLQRRRTQIRLAQRAYRERKETTISDLEKRVSTLNDIIGEMNQTFLDYNAKAISCGILTWNSTLGDQLKEATERFLHLAKIANPDANGNDSEHSLQESLQEAEHETTQAQLPMGQPEDNWMDPVVETPQRYLASTSEDMLGYSFTYEDLASNTSGLTTSPSFEPYPQSGLRSEFDTWPPRSDNTNALTKQPDWLPSLGMSIKPPSTYSFQETTLARRLYRAAFEQVYSLLRDPYVPREVLQRKLRFTFGSGQDPKTVERRVLDVLLRNAREPLEYWEFPDPVSQQNFNRHPFGPFTEAEARKFSAQQLARLARIDGTWLDPNDVEQYLKSKGLRVNGSSSLVEMEIDDSLPPLTADVVENSPQSISIDSLEGTPSPEAFIDPGINFFGTSQNQFFESTDTSFSGFPHSVPQEVAIQYADLKPQTISPKDVKGVSMYQNGLFSSLLDFDFTPGKRKVIVNVDKLVQSKCIKALDQT